MVARGNRAPSPPRLPADAGGSPAGGGKPAVDGTCDLPGGTARMTVAEWIVRACLSWTPKHLRHWTEAMARETAEINREGPALFFAFGCAVWAAKACIAHAVRKALSPDSETHGDSMMRVQDFWRGRGLALICGIAATLLGLVYLGAAGAPHRMLTMNLAALAAGLAIALPFFRYDPVQPPVTGVLAVAISAALLLTALLGNEASGARRWISVAGIGLQPSLILLPLLITAVARSRDALTALGVVIAAVALALQPDRAMAGALAAGLAAVVVTKRDRLGLFCLMVSIASFAITWLRPDVVPATPFVDRVFHTAFSTGAVSGVAVWVGAVLLLVPAALGVVRDRSHRPIHAAFGATWLAIIVAALIGDYPTPLVAYSGSSIVGYILASVGLPRGRAGSLRSPKGDIGRSTSANTPDAKFVVAVQ